jgi:hypothetical protein
VYVTGLIRGRAHWLPFRRHGCRHLDRRTRRQPSNWWFNCGGCYGSEFLFQWYLYDRFGGDGLWYALNAFLTPPPRVDRLG